MPQTVLLRDSVTAALWFFLAQWPRTSRLAGWQRVRRSRLDSSPWFGQGFGSRFLPTTTIRSAA
jgi:hypothetical protein